MGNMVVNPIAFFTDLQGKPMQGGSVYIGEPNTNPVTNPLTVYQDAAMTIPMAQPLKTLNGFVSLNGTPQPIYVNAAAYSLLANDQFGNLTLSIPDYTNPLQNQTGPGGAAQIGFDGTTLDKQFLTRVSRVVDSISAMQALSPSTYNWCEVASYHGRAVNQLGGGRFYYDSTVSQSSANGITIFSAAPNAGCWIRLDQSDLSLMDAGAYADGTTDDYPAIQAAIDSGITRFRAPAGTYLIKSVLNFTNRTKPIVISGDGGYYQQSTGTVFLFKTGSWMADCTGCQFSHFEHMRWLSDGTAGSATMGILFARSTVQDYSMYNTGFKMVVELPSSSGSSAGSIALANNCAENFGWDQCWFVADTPYASTLGNELSLTSTYATIANTIFSNTDKSFKQTVFQAINGYANNIYGDADSTFDQCNWTTLGAVGAGVVAAIILNPSADGYKYCENLRFTGDVENFPSVAYMTGNTSNLDIDVTTANTTAEYIKPYTGTVHDGMRLKFTTLSGTQQTLCTSVGAGVVFNNPEIWMSDGQTLLDGFLTLAGGVVHGGNNDLTNASVFSVASYTSLVSCKTTNIFGSTTFNPGGMPTGGTVASTAFTVTGAQLGACVDLYPPYALSGTNAWAEVTAANQVTIYISNLTGATVTLGSGLWKVRVKNI